MYGDQLYHENHKNKRKRTFLDWLILFVVVGVAILVIASSFHNTTKLARTLGMPPLLVAGSVEIAFSIFLFLRGHQRALKLNVPLFLHTLYFGVLALVTGVNMWGLSDMHTIWGPIIGFAISVLMWGMETTLVWFWTEKDRPHQKTPWEKMREAKKEIKEEKIIQMIEYMKNEAKKPSLALIKRARRDEKKRKRIETGQSFWSWSKSEEEGLPEYFREKRPDLEEVIAEELRKTEPKTVEVAPEPEVEPEQETGQLVPFKRPIGFHIEYDVATESNTKNTPNTETVSNTLAADSTTVRRTSNTPKTSVRSNTKKRFSSNTPTKKEQAIEYVIGLIERNEEYSVTSVANAVGCARSTASLAIREAKEKMMKKR